LNILLGEGFEKKWAEETREYGIFFIKIMKISSQKDVTFFQYPKANT
jgi:hypothetical protein